MTEEYWSIAIPELTYEQAVSFRERLLPESPRGVELIDPTETFVGGWDRSTVELMIKCLESGLAPGRLSDRDRMTVMALLKDCRAWLQQSSA